MLRMVLAFFPVALLLTLTPGVAMALVVRSAARGGRREAFMCTLGNGAGVMLWAALAAVGLAAVVATSAEAFAVVKLVGAAILIVLGVKSLRGKGGPLAGLSSQAESQASPRASMRDGLLTGIANPKLAVFFAALFPQFVPHGSPVLPAALLMGAMIVACDLVLYSALAWLVTRARAAFLDGPWVRRVERFTGAVLVGLGFRLALERR
jgi:threonine/homoserine/homoserine lactone efflux protein